MILACLVENRLVPSGALKTLKFWGKDFSLGDSVIIIIETSFVHVKAMHSHFKNVAQYILIELKKSFIFENVFGIIR